jgi:IS5 family transposase
LAKAVNRILATGRRIKAAGGAIGTKVRDRSRAVGRRAHELNAKLRTRNAAAKDEAMAIVKRKNAELADLAEATLSDAKRLLGNAKRAVRKAKTEAARRKVEGCTDPAQGRRRGRLVRAVNHLTDLIKATSQIIVQTRQRLAGTMPAAASRRVSLHDPEARPIAKGRLGKPVEFGYKAQVCDNVDGIVLDHDVQPGNPPDAPRLAPCIGRVKKRTGKAPRTVAADRGYGEAAVDDELTELGVTKVVIPRKGRPSKARQAHEHSRHFRQTIKWRTGCEGRISHLKRNYGWNRTRLDTLEGARTWTGHGTFAHNLTKIAALAA